MAVASVSRASVEPSQMDRSTAGAAASESPTSGAPPPVADPSDNSDSSPSTSKRIENQPSLRSEEYRQLFRLPPGEVLIQDFNCALQENFLLQGHMYVFVHCICFYSNLFGFETKKIIPFQEVTSVKRAKTAAIFPTAIEIIAAGKKCFFTSFLSRDEAFKLINDGWLAHGNEAKAILDLQESRSELNYQASGPLEVEKSNGLKQLVEELVPDKRRDGEFVSEDSEPSPSHEPQGSLNAVGVQEIVDEDAVLVLGTNCSSCQNSFVWKLEDSDAPDVPESYILAAESKFQIRVDEFFNLFFSDDAGEFLESYHKRCGDKDLKFTPWRPHHEFGHTRDVSFQHPIKIYFGARFGSCNEVQNFRVYRNSRLVIKTSQEVNDVPYGDYFCVEGLWDVETAGDESSGYCTLRVFVNVAFSKKTMWKGKIVQATVEECRDTFAGWIELAHELLKQKNIEKEEAEKGHPTTNSVPIGELNNQAEKRAGEFSAKPSVESDSLIPETGPNAMQANQLGAPLERSLRDAGASASSLTVPMAKLFSSFKLQSQVPSFVVIVLALVILLMQISIIFLLVRPQRVQVVSWSEWMHNGLSERRVQTISLLDKQISHLKEEMLIVETLLEKMRHEHDLLQSHLKNFMHHR